MNKWTPYRWRVTVEYESYEQAHLAGQLLRGTLPTLYMFDALDNDGESLWHERGALQLRPVFDK